MFYMHTEYEKKTKNFLFIILKKHRFWNKMSPRTSTVVVCGMKRWDILVKWRNQATFWAEWRNGSPWDPPPKKKKVFETSWTGGSLKFLIIKRVYPSWRDSETVFSQHVNVGFLTHCGLCAIHILRHAEVKVGLENVSEPVLRQLNRTKSRSLLKDFFHWRVFCCKSDDYACINLARG